MHDQALIAELNAQGLACKDLGRYDEARVLYLRALGLAGRVPYPSIDTLATLLHNLGGIEHAAGRFAEGEPHARRGLAIRRSIAGAESHEVACDMIALAAILDGLEQYDEAERLYLDGLAVLERSPDEYAIDIAVALNDLGAQYQRRDRLVEAEALLERAVALKSAALGRTHPAVAVSLNNLAVTCHRQSDRRRGAALHSEALAIFERTLGADHPSTIACRASFGALAAPGVTPYLARSPPGPDT